MTTGELRLRAIDSEDVQVISAVLQDAIVPICDMLFRGEDKSFVMVVQRLRREASAQGKCERICCALTISGVSSVQTTGIDFKNGEQMLELLAILRDERAYRLDFIFAGNAKLRLQLTDWFLTAEDFGESWPALSSPCHDAVATG